MTRRAANPFRPEPIVVPDAVARRQGVEPPTEALRRIETSRPEMADPAQVTAWLRHPDERVVSACIRRFWGITRYPPARPVVDERLARLSAMEPDVWSPIPDAAVLVGGLADTKPYERAMGRWFRRATAEEAARTAEAYPSGIPAYVAAKECRDWSPALVDAIRHRAPHAMERIARNRRMVDRDTASHVLDVLLQDAERTTKANMNGRNVEALAALLGRGLDLPADTEERLLAIVETRPAWIAAAAARALGSRPDFDDALGRRILFRLGEGRWQIAAYLIRGRRCSAAIARAALDLAPYLGVRREIAKRPDLLTDRRLRAALATSDCARIRRALIETGTPAEAAKLLNRLAETNAPRALEAMEDGALPEGTAVYAETLARLLESSASRTRERALTMLGEVTLAREIADDPEEERPAQRRGR